MRQTAPRRYPEKLAAPKSGRLSVAAGEHLDVGITVSVYCAGSATPGAAPAQPGDATADAAGPGCTEDFTEH